MMLAYQPQIYYTPAQYLALEKQAETRSEYHQGQIVAMAGASFRHNQVVSNLQATLYQAIGSRNCNVFSSDLRVYIEADNRYTYPDLLVLCEPPQFVDERDDTINNPQIIIEVLSKSTASLDRHEKFQAYWMLDSLKEYVLVDQYKMRVEYFRRVDETVWELRVLTKPEQTLHLQSLDIDIPLSQIYRRVSWEA
ncbi:Uma2 family endonuclease [Anaerolineales bacterium HSG24]|nr:Uma2 family endonuclease [Anaerolineales bacterium HSG24]